MKKRIVLYIMSLITLFALSSCVGGRGGHYYGNPTYDGYIVAVNSKTLPEIKDNNDIKIP